MNAFIEAVRVDSDAEEGASPLSFRAIVPEPTKDEYAAMDVARQIECDLCGTTGYRPTTAEEAALVRAGGHEVRWDDSWAKMQWLEEEGWQRRSGATPTPCNACKGTGHRTPTESWYEWRVENWGTKWDAVFDGGSLIDLVFDENADVETSKELRGVDALPGRATYRFDTAWGPPVPVVLAAAERWPMLSFELAYGEPGNNFAGKVCAIGTDVREYDLPIEDVLSAQEMWF